MFFDTHAHLTEEDIYQQLTDVLQRADEAGVSQLATIGYDWPSSLMGVNLAEKYPQRVYAAVGIHPHDAQTYTAEMEDKLSQLAASPHVVAIGEIGLDYYRDLSPRDLQQKVFKAQIALAQACQKPILIHDRDAHGDVMDILRRNRGGRYGGIIHCFSGSVEMAEECIKMGFDISIAGPVTFHNSKKLWQVVEAVPLEHLLIETDCPYLTPHPFRGTVNEPARVGLVAAKIAELKGITLQEVAVATTANAQRVYNLK